MKPQRVRCKSLKCEKSTIDWMPFVLDGAKISKSVPENVNILAIEINSSTPRGPSAQVFFNSIGLSNCSYLDNNSLHSSE
ncbi:uncharacterized protein LOC131079541 isoform X3 [Cryptomeria japonica]|uniref:uncharacterized protein LOC131079541 isoform X3 n=1 Tax=Cryptomeria japonica TaxID=3369 RepID=UPI0027DA40D9|nr:uncharacterized protein LOC131079541 isoform X3 [Cryptomeria japonica]